MRQRPATMRVRAGCMISVMVVTILLLTSPCTGKRIRKSRSIRSSPWAASIIELNADMPSDLSKEAHDRQRRNDAKLKATVTHLDSLAYNRALIHFAAGESPELFVVTQQYNPNSGVRGSHVFVSKDEGVSFDQITNKFPPDAIIERFYSSPHDSDHLLFVDAKHKRIYVTKNAADTFTPVDVDFVPAVLDFNDNVEDSLVAADFQHQELWVSNDGGLSWDGPVRDETGDLKLLDGFWGTPGVGTDKDDTLYVELARDDKSGLSRIVVIRSISQDVDGKNVRTEVLESPTDIKSGTVRVENQYIFYETPAKSNPSLYVSRNRGEFKLAKFPGSNPEVNYNVLDASEDTAFVAVDHGSTANIYTSDVTGTKFSLSLRDILYDKNTFLTDFMPTEGISGIFLSTQRVGGDQGQTVITYDKGGEWARVPAPEDSQCLLSNDCSLNLHLQQSERKLALSFNPVLSFGSAPGIILANGNTGPYLGNRNSLGFFLSRDAGATWKSPQVPDDEGLQFITLDHGGILVATKPYNFQTPGGNELYYSVDEGRTWSTYTIEGPTLQIVSILTELGETSTILSVWAYREGEGEWTVVTIDFESLLGEACQDDDYETWTPQSAPNIDCVLGGKQVFKRRKASSICFNGQDFDRPISDDACECTFLDFECDLGYSRKSGSERCTLDSFNGVLPHCEPGKTVAIESGYRKVAGNICEGGIEVFVEPFEYKCPDTLCAVSEWTEWQGCTPCGIGEKRFRTRTITEEDFPDASLCPPLFEVDNCPGADVDGQISIAPRDPKFEINAPALLAATFAPIGQSDECLASGEINLRYSWSLGDSGPAMASSPGRPPVTSKDVIEDLIFTNTGVFTIEAEASTGSKTFAAKTTLVVFTEYTWAQVAFLVPPNIAESLRSTIPDFLMNKFPGLFASATNERSALVDSVRTVATDQRDTLLVQFRLLSTDSDADRFFTETLESLRKGASQGVLSVSVAGATIQADDSSVEEIDAPDSVAPTNAPSTKKSKDSTPVVIAIAVVVIVLVVSVATFFVLRARASQNRYRQLDDVRRGRVSYYSDDAEEEGSTEAERPRQDSRARTANIDAEEPSLEDFDEEMLEL